MSRRSRRASCDLHDSPPLVKRMGDVNLRRVEDYFIDKCAEHYEAVFEDAVRTAGGARTRGER